VYTKKDIDKAVAEERERIIGLLEGLDDCPSFPYCDGAESIGYDEAISQAVAAIRKGK